MSDATHVPPTPPSPRWTDHEVDQVIGRLLQVGVLLASLVVAIGTVMLLARSGSAPIDFAHLPGANAGLHSVHGIIALVRAGDPLAIIQLGLLMLIATPIARVALTLGAFAIQRDRLYVALTAVVLALLLAGLF